MEAFQLILGGLNILVIFAKDQDIIYIESYNNSLIINKDSRVCSALPKPN
jgi:hypothetical protein